MSALTHESKWRLLIGAAPLVGVAFLVWAAAQGETEVARSPTARAILAGVAALGAAVAWRTARQLRAAPTVPVARAGRLARNGRLAGVVAMRGRARALPDAGPLVSPDGELCLWFRHVDRRAQASGAHDSDRPFLLVDPSGACVVLPAGADITGSGQVASPARDGADGANGVAGPDALRAAERLLRDGDRIQVIGRFVAASAAVAPGIALPRIVAPGSGRPLVIRIGSDSGTGGVYEALAVVDSLVLVVSAGLVAWPLLGLH